MEKPTNYLAITICGIAGAIIVGVIMLGVRHYYVSYHIEKFTKSLQDQAEKALEESRQRLAEQQNRQAEVEKLKILAAREEREAEERLRLESSYECRFWRQQIANEATERAREKINEYCWTNQRNY